MIRVKALVRLGKVSGFSIFLSKAYFEERCLLLNPADIVRSSDEKIWGGLGGDVVYGVLDSSHPEIGRFYVSEETLSAIEAASLIELAKEEKKQQMEDLKIELALAKLKKEIEKYGE